MSIYVPLPVYFNSHGPQTSSLHHWHHTLNAMQPSPLSLSTYHHWHLLTNLQKNFTLYKKKTLLGVSLEHNNKYFKKLVKKLKNIYIYHKNHKKEKKRSTCQHLKKNKKYTDIELNPKAWNLKPPTKVATYTVAKIAFFPPSLSRIIKHHNTNLKCLLPLFLASSSRSSSSLPALPVWLELWGWIGAPWLLTPFHPTRWWSSWSPTVSPKSSSLMPTLMFFRPFLAPTLMLVWVFPTLCSGAWTLLRRLLIAGSMIMLPATCLMWAVWHESSESDYNILALFVAPLLCFTCAL